MSKKDKTDKSDKKETKAEVEIIRGRMPVAIAAAIKLTEPEDAKDADLAAKYRTTNGKIADIRADRNFAYIKKDFKPTKDMVLLAKKYAEQCEKTNSIMKAVKGFGVASEEEAEKFASDRKGARKTPGKPKDEKKSSKKDKDVDEDEDDDDNDDDLDDLLDEDDA